MTDRLINKKLGVYTVRELLGSGGMGSVYKGYDSALARDVAIKVIGTGELLPDAVERFRREARLAAALRHPNIVQIYAFDKAEGILYMVQELLPGPTLADQLRRMGKRRLSSATIKRTIGQLAAALDYAHSQGVIHRDVKPGNALYNAAGELVLTDFGLARDADVRATTTAPGMVMGTPGYVAPEQAVSSKGVTKAVDIYALGVLLFELLTGRLPFEADSAMGVVLKHLYDAPPAPSSLRPDLPKAVDGVVLRALRKEPEGRYSSASALSDALAAAWPEATAGAKTASSAAKPAPGSNANLAPAERPAARAVARAGGGEPNRPGPARPSPKPDTTRATPKLRPASDELPRPAAKTEPAPPKPAIRASTSPAAPARPTKASLAPAPVMPMPSKPTSRWPARVGLITASAVVALILFGSFSADLNPETMMRGWRALLAMLGR